MITQAAYLKKVEIQLKVWGDRIDRLTAKATTIQATNRITCQEQINELAQKLQTLQHINGDDWTALRGDVEQTLTVIGASYDQAKEKIVWGSCLGWAEGMAQKRTLDSEGWVEGMGHRCGHSEGWVEGMGYQLEDSIGWAEGMIA